MKSTFSQLLYSESNLIEMSVHFINRNSVRSGPFFFLGGREGDLV